MKNIIFYFLFYFTHKEENISTHNMSKESFIIDEMQGHCTLHTFCFPITIANSIYGIFKLFSSHKFFLKDMSPFRIDLEIQLHIYKVRLDNRFAQLFNSCFNDGRNVLTLSFFCG